MISDKTIELTHCVENRLPRLHNWSGRQDSHDPIAPVCLVATTDRRLGSEAHQGVVPAATMVSLRLDDESLASLARVVERAMEQRRLGRWAKH